MSATAKMQGTKIVRVLRERGASGFYFATSDDLEGLVVSAESLDELDDLVPNAITQLYAACGEQVIVTWIENAEEDDVKEWAAIPAQLARQELEKFETA